MDSEERKSLLVRQQELAAAKRDNFMSKRLGKKLPPMKAVEVEAVEKKIDTYDKVLQNCLETKETTFFGNKHFAAGLLCGTALFWSMSRIFHGSVKGKIGVSAAFFVLAGSGALGDMYVNDYECRKEAFKQFPQLPQ